MKHKRVYILFLIGWTMSLSLQAQNNPFKIDDELYADYQRCNKVLKEKVVLAMADSLFHKAARKGDVKAQCLALHLKSDHYYYVEDIPTLRKAIKRVRDFAIKTPYKQYVFSPWAKLITYYTRQRDYGAAMKEVQAYREEAIRLNNAYAISFSYRYIGNIYLLQSNHVRAIQEYMKGIHYSITQHETTNLHEIYLSVGKAYRYMKQYDSAFVYFEKVLEMIPENTKFNIYLPMSTMALEQNKMEIATQYMEKMEKWIAKYPLHGADRDSYFAHMSRYYSKCKNFDKAISMTDSIKNAFPLAQQKYLLYSDMADYEQAFKWLKQLRNMEKQKANKEVNDKLNELTVRFDTERLKAEKNRLALQNSQLKLQQTESEKQLIKTEQERTRLELDNRELALKQHQNELDKSHKETIYQQERAKTMEMYSRQHFTMSVILGLLLLVLLVFAVIYYVMRRHSMEHLRREKEIAVKARGQAESAREQAEAARKQAENANHLKSLFLQNMSHEIRTPLNAIVGFTEVLNSDEDLGLTEEERKEMLELINTNTELLTTLVNDILDLSKLESDTYTLSLSPVSITELCHATLASVAHRISPGVELRIDEPSNANELILNTDIARLQQILTNLLTNACKYTEEGSITLAYRHDKTEWEFSVTDTGCGIPPEKAETIFERFEKLDSFKQGTGLGLNICRRIAELVGGRVYLDTSYTGGARFVFMHPVIIKKEKTE